MGSKGFKLSDFGRMSEAEKDRVLDELAKHSGATTIDESIKRLRKILDEYEYEHKMTTEDMVASMPCTTLDEDPVFHKWVTCYAAYRQLLVNLRQSPQPSC